MPSITIRKLDAETKSRLRIRAAHHNRSMEEEARDILRSVLSEAPGASTDLAAAVRRRFEPLGGIELEIPPRQPMRAPPELGE